MTRQSLFEFLSRKFLIRETYLNLIRFFEVHIRVFDLFDIQRKFFRKFNSNSSGPVSNYLSFRVAISGHLTNLLYLYPR